MANNRHSASCLGISKFDSYLKENYFPLNSNGGVCNIRGTIMDKYPNKEEFSPEKVEEINKKLELGETLTDEDKTFVRTYAESVKKLQQDINFKTALEERIAKAGIRRNAISTMYKTFKTKFPAQYRNEVLMQIVSGIIRILDSLETDKEYKHFSRAEIIEDYGIENLLADVRDDIADVRADLPAETEEQKQIFDTLLTDTDAIEAVFFMARTKIFEAEKIKMGIDTESATDEEDGLPIESKEIQNAEYQGAEHWMLRTDCIRSFNSLSKENRSILYKLTDGKVGILGLPSIVDTLLIHQQLCELRHENACTTSTEFLNALTSLNEEKCPWAIQLYEILKDNPGRRTAFFNGYRKNHLNYLSLRRESFNNSTGGPVFYENTTHGDSNIPYQIYVAEMYDIQDQDRCLFDTNGNIVRDRQKALLRRLTESFKVDDKRVLGPVYISANESINDKPEYNIENWNSSIGKDPLNPTEEEIKEKKRDFINTMNAALNLHLDQIEIDDLMSSEKFDKFMMNICELVVNDMAANNVNSLQNLVDKKLYAAHLKNIASSSKTKISLADRKSPVEKTFRFNGSTYVTYTMCNHIGDTLERISKAAKEAVKKNDIKIFKEFIEKEYLGCRVYATKVGDEYKIHNLWLKELYNSTIEDLKKESSFFHKFTSNLQRAVGMDEKDFEDFNEKEGYILLLNSYFTTRRDTDGEFGRYPLFITGDSNSTRFLTAPILSENAIEDGFVEMAMQECERMIVFKDIIDWCNKNNYTAPYNVINNANSFTLFPFLNSESGLLDLYNTDKSKFREKVKDLIREHIFEKQYKEYIKDLQKSKSVKDNPIVSPLGEDVLNKSVLTIKVKNDKDSVNSNTSLLKEYFLNYKYAMMQQLQFLTVDPGFYDGTNDMQKRYKEMIAAGTPLDLDALDLSDPSKKVDDNDGMQDVIYVQEQKYATDKSVLKALEEAEYPNGKRMFADTSKYEDSTATDGQAWRSFTSYRKICIMLGGDKWTSAHEEVYQIILANRKAGKTRLEEKDLRKILELGVVFQPIKPFYYGIEKIAVDNGKGEIHIPVQHKCSEYPVIPELLPEGNILGELGKAMEDSSKEKGRKSIDLVICTSAVKVGGFGATVINDLTDAESIRTALDKGYRHVLPLTGWREQSNVPEHADCSRARGTQLILHWLSNIAGTINKDYPFLKKYFPSGEIQFTKTSAPVNVSQGLNEGTLLKLFNHLASFGFIKSCIKEVKTLSNPNEMSNLLSNLRANDSRAANDNIDAYTINEKGEFKISPSEGLLAADNIAVLFSHIRKNIIKQGMKGGSLVQVSTYGFQDVLKVHTEKILVGKTEKTNITYADSVQPFDFSITDENGKLIKLDYLDYVDYNTGNLLKEDGTAFSDKEIEELEEKGVDWRKQSKLEKQFPGILDSLDYRIPTEGHCSVLNLRVRKFLPLTAGAIIIVPAVYTTIAGFDFDIDKLYFIRKEYRIKRLNQKEEAARIAQVWLDIYGKETKYSKGTSKIYKALKAAQASAHAQKEGPDEVVAQSSGFTATTLGDLIDFKQLYSTIGATSESTSEENDVELPDSKTDASERSTKNSEVNEQINEYENLYQYWEEAGLSEQEEEDGSGGVGMTAEEYFENYFKNNISKYTQYEKWDKSKPLYNQSQAVINNLLFDLYKARLEDYDTFQERFTPSGYANLKRAKPLMLAIRYGKEDLARCKTFADLKKLAKEKFEKYTPAYDATNPSTVVHYQVQNALYDKLIGISANQNINQKYTSLLEIFELKSPIKWGSMLNSKDPAMGSDVKKRFMHTVDPQTDLEETLDTEASSKENLGASVDAVKDALLEFFGMTINNFNLANFMGKIGAYPEDVGLLLNQPVVQIAMGIIESSNGFIDLSEALYEALELLSDKNTAKALIDENLPAFKKEGRKTYGTSERDKLVDLDALTLCIAQYAGANGKKITDGKFLNTQLAVISLMQELQIGATVVSDQINITKTTSVNIIQSDFGSIEAVEQRANSFKKQFSAPDFPFKLTVTSTREDLQNTVIDPDARIPIGREETFLDRFMGSAYGLAQAAYSAIMTFVDSVVCQYFPYKSQGFMHTKNILATFTNKDKLNADIINAANKFIPMYCLERMVPLFQKDEVLELTDLNEKSIPVNIPKKIFYSQYFPQWLIVQLNANDKMCLKNKDIVNYREIPILSYITPRKENLNKGFLSSRDILKADTIGSLLKDQKDNLIESWEQMFKSNDKILQNIALHLFMYSYYTGGFDFGTTTFMSLAPLALKVALGISEDGNEENSYVYFFNRLFNLTSSTNGAYLRERGRVNSSSISVKQLIKSFLMNYGIKFTQLTKNVYGSKSDLYKQITDRLKITPNEFTVDYTDKNQDSSLRGLIAEVIKDEKGETIAYKMKPCVVIHGNEPSIFMCDIDWDNDNAVNFSRCKGKITYYRVKPILGKDSSNVEKMSSIDSSDPDYRSMMSTAVQQLREQLQEILSKADEDAGSMSDDSNSSSVETIRTKAINNAYESIRKLANVVINSIVSKHLDNALEIINGVMIAKNEVEKEIFETIKTERDRSITMLSTLNKYFKEAFEHLDALDDFGKVLKDSGLKQAKDAANLALLELGAVVEMYPAKQSEGGIFDMYFQQFMLQLNQLAQGVLNPSIVNEFFELAEHPDVLKQISNAIDNKEYDNENVKSVVNALNEIVSDSSIAVSDPALHEVASDLFKLLSSPEVNQETLEDMAKDGKEKSPEELCNNVTD